MALADPKTELSSDGAPRSKKASLKPITDTVIAVLAGNLEARVQKNALDEDAADLANLFNQLLERFSVSEHRKQVAAQEIDQAVDALISLGRDGDLARWNTTTEDPQLAPLLEGFGKVIETLRTFVREINEAALRLSSSSNQVLSASTQHETSSDRKSTRLNSSHSGESRMPSSA